MKKLFSALLCSSMLLNGAGLPVLAQEESTSVSEAATIIYHGKIGTADWSIDSNGTLTIGEGEFSNDDHNYEWPWREHLSEVKHVDGTAAFKVNGRLNGVFFAGYGSDNPAIESITLSGWDTSSVTDMGRMFDGCKSLTSVDLSGLDISSVDSMASMFDSCSSLVSLDLSSLSTSSVTYLGYMFGNCSSLVSLDLSGFDTSSVTGTTGMFEGCSSLVSLDLSHFDTSALPEMYMDYMFQGCSSLSTIRYPEAARNILSQLPEQEGWYQDGEGPFDIDNLPNVADGVTALLTRSKTEGPDIVHEGKVGTADWTIDSNGVLTIGEGEVTNEYNTNQSWKEYLSSVTKVDGTANFKVQGTLEEFFGSSEKQGIVNDSIREIDLSGWDVSSVTNMGWLFSGLSSLESLNISSWDTSSVQCLRSMCLGCSSLTSLDVKEWDTSNVVEMGEVFESCSSLTSIDISDWDTSSANTMVGMFAGCYSLKSLDLGNWDVSSVKNMNNMFMDCPALTSLDISKWDTSSLEKADSIFLNCLQLSSICYSQGAADLLTKLPEQSGWYQDGEGPYDIDNLPNVANGMTALLTRSKTEDPYIVHQGKIGTADWTIDSNGVLTIGEGEVSNEYNTLWPWKEYLGSVTKVDGTANFKVSGTMEEFFGESGKHGYGNNTIREIDLTGWDVSDVTNMAWLFSGLSSLESVKISNWNTSSVEMLRAMCAGCSSLTSIDVKEWDTSNVIDMGEVFESCSSLTSIDINDWDTSSVITMNGMFAWCSSLKSLDLSRWDVSSVENMNNMFMDSPALFSLDISNWDASSVEDTESIFGNYTKPSTIRYSQGAADLLMKLPDQSGWYQDGFGPYSIQDLPAVPSGKSALLTRTGTSKPNPPQKDNLYGAKVTGINASYTETGSPIAPKPGVELNGKVLKEGTDYKLSYSNNKTPGKATITITGIGNYEGTKTVNFTITKKPSQPAAKTSLSGAKISGINESYVETGSAITPKPKVELNGKALKEGTDYKLSYTNNVKPGKATITIEGIGNYQGSKTVNFSITAKKKPEDQNPSVVPAKKSTMHRLYNPNSGEHFYTSNDVEKNHLVSVGWKYEGEGWKAPEKSNKPVYRLYNPNAGDHHYTLDKNEKDTLVNIGWNDEGIGWYSDEAEGVPLYRQYNPNATAGSHNYTTDKNENDSLVKLGWQAEGIGWYGMK